MRDTINTAMTISARPIEKHRITLESMLPDVLIESDGGPIDIREPNRLVEI
jgi:hypothetical protein